MKLNELVRRVEIPTAFRACSAAEKQSVGHRAGDGDAVDAQRRRRGSAKGHQRPGVDQRARSAPASQRQSNAGALLRRGQTRSASHPRRPRHRPDVSAQRHRTLPLPAL